MIRYLKAIALLATTLCLLSLAALFQHVDTTMTRVDVAVEQANDLLAESNKRMVGTSQNLNAILIQFGLAADNLRRASESQDKVSKKTQELLDNANALLQHTEKNTDQITLHTVRTMDAMQPVLDKLATTTDETNKLIANQNIPQILQNLNETSKQVAETSQNLNKTSDHVEKFVAKATKPASVAKQVFKNCLSFLGGVFAHFI